MRREETTEEINLSTLVATELADYCIDLWEKIHREKSKLLKKVLTKQYNQAANYYNTNINPKIMKLC
jgi:hypothetical protein